MTNNDASILVIGTGSIGERHLRCFQTLDRGLVGGCEPGEALRNRIQETYKCPMFASLDEAFSARPWTAAVICTPAQTHLPIARKCAERGMHVLIEKPLATSSDGLTELADEVKARRLIARVAYVHRSIPTVRAMRDLLQSGQIGEVKHIAVAGGQHFPTFRPAYASTYFARRETGGGAIQDALTHVVHAVEWLVSPFASVFCDASHQVLEGVEVEDTVSLVGRLKNGVPVAIVQNLFQAPVEFTITLHGVKGSIRGEFHRQRTGLWLRGQEDWQWNDLPREERDGMFIRQAAAFLDATEGKPDDLATLDDGWQTLRVNLAALQSSDERKEIFL